MSEINVSSRSCLESILEDLSPGLVLDVGCGDGSFTRVVAQHTESAVEILGIDPDKDSIDEARLLTDDRRIRYRVLAEEELRSATGKFDLVTVSNAVHHFSRPVDSIRRIATYLAPGGVLLIREFVSDNLNAAERNARDLHHTKAKIDRECGRTHHDTFTREQVRRIIHDGTNGWRVERSCEERSEAEDGSPMLGYLREYLDHVSDAQRRSTFSDQLDRIERSMAEVGFVYPPRMILRCPRES